MPKLLINEREAAEMLDVSVSFMQSDRVTGRHGIPYVKVGRSIKYRPETLLAWLASRTVDAKAPKP